MNGVSTLNVDRLVEALSLAGMSKDTVSRLCRGLDDKVTAFLERPPIRVSVVGRQGREGAGGAGGQSIVRW